MKQWHMAPFGRWLGGEWHPVESKLSEVYKGRGEENSMVEPYHVYNFKHLNRGDWDVAILFSIMQSHYCQRERAIKGSKNVLWRHTLAVSMVQSGVTSLPWISNWSQIILEWMCTSLVIQMGKCHPWIRFFNHLCLSQPWQGRGKWKSKFSTTNCH